MTREQARQILAQLPKKDLRKIKQTIIALEIKRRAKEAVADRRKTSHSLPTQTTTNDAQPCTGKLSPKH